MNASLRIAAIVATVACVWALSLVGFFNPPAVGTSLEWQFRSDAECADLVRLHLRRKEAPRALAVLARWRRRGVIDEAAYERSEALVGVAMGDVGPALGLMDARGPDGDLVRALLRSSSRFDDGERMVELLRAHPKLLLDVEAVEDLILSLEDRRADRELQAVFELLTASLGGDGSWDGPALVRALAIEGEK